MLGVVATFGDLVREAVGAAICRRRPHRWTVVKGHRQTFIYCRRCGKEPRRG